MRKHLIAWFAAAAVVVAASAPAGAQLPTVHGPQNWLPGFPSPGHPIWPGHPWHPVHPGPWRPIYPQPRPPVIQIRYTVFYRIAPFGGWRVYASYATHAQAVHVERWLRGYGYQTDLVVTY